MSRILIKTNCDETNLGLQVFSLVQGRVATRFKNLMIENLNKVGLRAESYDHGKTVIMLRDILVVVDFPGLPKGENNSYCRGAVRYDDDFKSDLLVKVTSELNRWGTQSSKNWREVTAKKDKRYTSFTPACLLLVPFHLDCLDAVICYERLETLAERISVCFWQDLALTHARPMASMTKR